MLPTAAPHPYPSAFPGAVVVDSRDLRYLLTEYLFSYGPLPVDRLVTLLHADGFAVHGRPSKVVSDALRWEVGRKRVVRSGRGRYEPGVLPPTTARRLRKRTTALRALAHAALAA